jgi:hypothetical protein
MGSKRGQVTAKPETPAQALGRLVRQQRKLMGQDGITARPTP